MSERNDGLNLCAVCKLRLCFAPVCALCEAKEEARQEEREFRRESVLMCAFIGAASVVVTVVVVTLVWWLRP